MIHNIILTSTTDDKINDVSLQNWLESNKLRTKFSIPFLCDELTSVSIWQVEEQRSGSSFWLDKRLGMRSEAPPPEPGHLAGQDPTEHLSCLRCL